jgi:transaldolase
VRYVEELIGPDTVNTMPLETISAFADHGRVRGATLTEDGAEAVAKLEELSCAGIDLQAVSRELEAAGVRLFEESFNQLLDGVARRAEALRVGGAV